MSASRAGSVGTNIANKMAGNIPRTPRSANQAKQQATKQGKGKQPSSASAGKKSAVPSKNNSSGARSSIKRPNPEDIIESAPRSLVLSLYKQLLRRSRSFQFTNKEFFARRMHEEFMKRKDVKDNNLYYIRGKWMLENSMGGLL